MVLNPETPASAAAPVLHKLDVVVIMLSSPGSPAAPPAPAAAAVHGDLIDVTLGPAIDKLREVVTMCEERSTSEGRGGGGGGASNRLWVAVEGGVSRRTAADFIALGMDVSTSPHPRSPPLTTQ